MWLKRVEDETRMMMMMIMQVDDKRQQLSELGRVIRQPELPWRGGCALASIETGEAGI